MVHVNELVCGDLLQLGAMQPCRDVELGGLVAWAGLDALFKLARLKIQLANNCISTALKLDFTHEHYRSPCSR